MKYILFVLAVLCFVGHTRLPVNAPTTATTHINPEATRVAVSLADVGMRVASWEVRDYGLWKTAHSPWLGVTMLADPVSGKWSRIE